MRTWQPPARSTRPHCQGEPPGSPPTPPAPKPGGNGSDPFYGAPLDPTAWGSPQTNPLYNSGAHPGDTKYFNAGLGPDPLGGIGAIAGRFALTALFAGGALALGLLLMKRLTDA